MQLSWGRQGTIPQYTPSQIREQSNYSTGSTDIESAAYLLLMIVSVHIHEHLLAIEETAMLYCKSIHYNTRILL